jgi:hypothetical protein
MNKPISLFISFTPEDRTLMNALLRHIAPMKRSGKIDFWERGLAMLGKKRREILEKCKVGKFEFTKKEEPLPFFFE